MNKARIIKTLKKFKEIHCQEYGIERLGIFGSYSRGEAGRESDVDVVVHLARQDLFNIIGIKQDLEETLLLPVDVVSYRAGMDSYLKMCIDREAEYV